ncbi:MAG: right-handed parallel beta-helix repeat-containing protein [Parasphingorhabdus sp.]|nr:right-handed parallel beta-helix repeat-containing protein [Parasphingorhabdus sp.]
MWYMFTSAIALMSSAVTTVAYEANNGAATQVGVGAQAPKGGKGAVAGTDIVALLTNAADGSTVTLPAGDYGVVTIPQRKLVRGITLDASAARFTALVINHVEGLTIKGGTIIGEAGFKTGYAINARWVKRLTIRDMRISGSVRGIVVSDAENIELMNNQLTALRSDGINFAIVKNILVQGNSCSAFTPIKATYDQNGKLLKDGDHPDCIQSWATDGSSYNIRVIGNRMEGFMQGIFITPSSAGIMQRAMGSLTLPCATISSGSKAIPVCGCKR